jgi:hypothetical protein
MDQVGHDGGHPQLGSFPVGHLVGLGLDPFFGSARLGWALLGGRLCLLLLRRACSRLRLWLLGGGLLIFFLVFLVFGAAPLPRILIAGGGVDGALRLRHGALWGGGEGREAPRRARIAARVRALARCGRKQRAAVSFESVVSGLKKKMGGRNFGVWVFLQPIPLNSSPPPQSARRRHSEGFQRTAGYLRHFQADDALEALLRSGPLLPPATRERANSRR